MIVLVSQYKFPAGDAGSTRIHGFATTAKILGEFPFVIGHGEITNGIRFFKNIPYISLRLHNKYLSYSTFSVRLVLYLSQINHNHPIKAIIVGTVDNPTFILIKLFCRIHKIQIIKDAVEWYSKFQTKHGALSRSYLEKNIENKYLITKQTKVIAISTFLENYFKSKGINTVRIPVYMDQRFRLDKRISSSRITITYAGQPGKKDFIHIILKSLSMLDDKSLALIDFHLIGCSDEQVHQLCLENNIDYSKLRTAIHIHGRVPRDVVIDYLLVSDYTILIRNPNERYSQAGFPSKIIESISYGVVPILNYSSDLKLYFKDGINSIIVDGYDEESLKKALIRAISFSYEDRLRMSKQARILALECFNIASYKNELAQILNI